MTSKAHSVSATVTTDKPVIVHGSYIAVDLPSVPHAASPRSLRVSEDTYDAIDAFFGVTRATRTVCVSGIRDSCHDSTPPPYPHHNELPEYSSRDAEAGFKEPATLAMYLFKYGFLFPPFWFIGSFILFTPLRAPEGRELTKTMGEGLDWISSMRKIELKWARRCLIASVVLLVLVLVITVAVWRVVNA